MPPRAKASAPTRTAPKRASTGGKPKNRAPSVSSGSEYGEYGVKVTRGRRGMQEETEVDEAVSEEELLPRSLDLMPLAKKAPPKKAKKSPNSRARDEEDEDASGSDSLLPQSLEEVSKPQKKAPRKPGKKVGAGKSDPPSDPRAHTHSTIKGLCGTIRADMTKLDATQKSYSARIDKILEGITPDPVPTRGVIKLFETRTGLFEQLGALLNKDESVAQSDAFDAAVSEAHTYFTVTRPAETQAAGAELRREVDAVIRDTDDAFNTQKAANTMIKRLGDAIDSVNPTF
ncbi:uncharacterized protein LOC62_03G004006 [Vanrija pseudolonga]|uniref:Uncharacterized protein n=1 Tax=Vanrija pseudolonga TaxID=143232 RepID=A0AAF0Y5R5_9TREE|nr:hypothetical protein LOC62_03G004006 [Vanrija pseudolonga]